LQAKDFPSQLLPPIELNDSDQFNLYPEKPELNNAILQQELVGSMTTKVTYLLHKPGQITIPAIAIEWFNTASGKNEITRLPARTIDVAASADNTANIAQGSGATNIENKNLDSAEPFSLANKFRLVAWFLLLFLIVAIILILLFWFFRSQVTKGRGKRLAIKRLREACIKNDASSARRALLKWASLHWPDDTFLDLDDIAKKAHDLQLKKQIKILSEALYSHEVKNIWRGADLWAAVAAYRKKNMSNKSKKSGLPPINP
jgi:hypothetical protein